MQKANQIFQLLNKTGAHDSGALGRELGLSEIQMKQTFDGLVEQGLPLRINAQGEYGLQHGIHLLDTDEIAGPCSKTFL